MQKQASILFVLIILFASNIAKAQDNATLKEIAWLKDAVQKSLSFDTTLYKKIQVEFYSVMIECESKRIKNIKIKENETGLLKTVLLSNLCEQLIGHQFQSYYIPKVIMIPIVLMNPLSDSYGGFDFTRIVKMFDSDDISLVKSFWVLKALYYKGSIDRWKRWDGSEQGPW